MGFRRGDFPVAEKVAEEVLSLPMFPGLVVTQQNSVVEKIAHFEWMARGVFPLQLAAQA